MKTSDKSARGAETSPPSGPKALYRFNHDHLPPIPFVDELPPTEKPTLSWYGEVIWQALRNVRNRLNWAQRSRAQGAAALPSAALLSFPGDEDGVLELEPLGLDEAIDLDDLSLAHATPEEADGAAGPVVSFGQLSAT